MTLPNEIDGFLASKNFSANTKSNYKYDLTQLLDFFAGKILNETTLELYKNSLNNRSIAAQKRKISSCNHYLSYLYQQKKIEHFYKLIPEKTRAKVEPELTTTRMKEFPEFYAPLQSPGQFLALIILEFGLNFSEIQQLKWENFDWKFKILTIEKRGIKRVLPIREKFSLRVKNITNANEVFNKSRQFLYIELKKFTSATSKEIREQYILRQIRSGKTIYEVAKLLGLSTIVTLEKYYK
ncbi:site-specific tyrosine recombinase XerD [Lactococcus nasutitermitis]|uniref:Site-specific tyrosine recombinase XerD n=1 Tax=Lactococcus nasutitermitis TaxID=1652957 RepID=A0ABV9JGQ7_9LACT|nr:site-specific tyrosine recombinase XerD [Lactococcus nasutitermitis]